MPQGFFEDATFVRFRELSLAYTIPRTRFSVTAGVRNLALWTRYRGPDPEVGGGDGYNVISRPESNTTIVANNARYDGFAVPLARYWFVRLNVGY